MPPNNSPGEQAPEETSADRTPPLTPLSYLSSPVPDLASTLLTQSENNAQDENLRFLRLPEEHAQPGTATASAPVGSATEHRHRRLARQLDQLNPATRADQVAPLSTENRREEAQSDRMSRVLSRLSRFDEAGRPRGGHVVPRNTHSPTFGSLTAVRNLADEVADLREIIEDLRRRNPEVNPDLANIIGGTRLEGEGPSSEASRAMSASAQTSSQILSNLQRAEQAVESLGQRLQSTQRRLEDREHYADDLRSTAIMQNARSSANTTERMLRYIQQREQIGNPEGDHQNTHDSTSLSRWIRFARGINFAEPDADAVMTDVPELSISGSRNAHPVRQQNLERYRRDYLSPHPTSRHHQSKPRQPQVTPLLQNAVSYLYKIKDAVSYDEVLDAAVNAGFTTEEILGVKHNDVLTDVEACRPPRWSSWLQPGIRFIGKQDANLPTCTHSQPSYTPYSPPSFRNFDATRPLAVQNPLAGANADSRMRSGTRPPDQWPVKVFLHQINYEDMTLSGTMEAYDIPTIGEATKQPGTKNWPITTFLEGQIIDLKKHTFLTPASTIKREGPHSAANGSSNLLMTGINFPESSAAIDAFNWRRLPPFSSSQDDDEVARTMLSVDRMSEVHDKFIFMRWKERCFVHRKDDTCPASPQAQRRNVAPQQSSSASDSAGQDRQATTPSQSRPEATADLHSARYVSEASFSQPIPRFPRPSQQATQFPPPATGAPADQTSTNIPSLPAPPSTSPGLGPNIIAHISPQQARLTAASRRRQSSLLTQGIRALSAREFSNNVSNVETEPNARSRPQTTTVLGEGDDTDTGHGLTICGFYYVSLERATGELVGLYWDPGTSPYQCLKLKGEGAGNTGSWTFT